MKILLSTRQEYFFFHSNFYWLDIIYMCTLEVKELQTIMNNEKRQELIFKLKAARENYMNSSTFGESFSEPYKAKAEWEQLKNEAIGPLISTAITVLAPKYGRDELVAHLRKTTDVFDPVVREVANTAFGDDPYAFGVDAVVVGKEATEMLLAKLVVDHYDRSIAELFQ